MTDINYSEYKIRYANDDYSVHHDSIGLSVLPNTGAETITSVVKYMLLYCALPIICVEDKHAMEQL